MSSIYQSRQNSALARSDSDYGMLGLKASFSRNLWTFGMEGGVTYNYQNTIYVTSNEYYNIIADELVNVKSDKTEKFNLYEYTPQFDLDKLKPYWNLDIKVNLAEDKKSHPLRGSMYVGCTLSMRHFISELYKDLTIEQITSKKNKITAYQQKKWSEIPGGGGLRIGMNF